MEMDKKDGVVKTGSNSGGRLGKARLLVVFFFLPWPRSFPRQDGKMERMVFPHSLSEVVTGSPEGVLGANMGDERLL